MSLLPNFPSSPTNGQIASVGDYTYIYSSSTDSWEGQLGGDSGSGIFAQLFTSSGTFTVPSGVSAVKVTVIGGGGGGGGATAGVGQISVGGGGGGGGTAIKWVTGLVPGSTVTVTVGIGGSGNSGSNGLAQSGGTSSFGTHCSATGGVGGALVGNNAGVGGSGGNGSNGNFNIPGGKGMDGYITSGNTYYSSGGGGATNYATVMQNSLVPYTSGQSFWGIGGLGQDINSYSSVGNGAGGFGAGGGGALRATGGGATGGAGTAGFVLVEWAASVLTVNTITGGGLGYSQSWTDVSGSRNFGVTYTNTTGKPIQILVVASTSGVGGGVNLNIGGVGLSGFFAYSGAVTVTSPPLIVPPGATYSASAYGNASYAAWYELR